MPRRPTSVRGASAQHRRQASWVGQPGVFTNAHDRATSRRRTSERRQAEGGRPLGRIRQECPATRRRPDTLQTLLAINAFLQPNALSQRADGRGSAQLLKIAANRSDRRRGRCPGRQSKRVARASDVPPNIAPERFHRRRAPATRWSPPASRRAGNGHRAGCQIELGDAVRRSLRASFDVLDEHGRGVVVDEEDLAPASRPSQTVHDEGRFAPSVVAIRRLRARLRLAELMPAERGKSSKPSTDRMAQNRPGHHAEDPVDQVRHTGRRFGILPRRRLANRRQAASGECSAGRWRRNRSERRGGLSGER